MLLARKQTHETFKDYRPGDQHEFTCKICDESLSNTDLPLSVSLLQTSTLLVTKHGDEALKNKRKIIKDVNSIHHQTTETKHSKNYKFK